MSIWFIKGEQELKDFAVLDFLPDFDAAEDDKRGSQERKTDSGQAADEATNRGRVENKASARGNGQRARRMAADINPRVVDRPARRRRQDITGL